MRPNTVKRRMNQPTRTITAATRKIDDRTPPMIMFPNPGKIELEVIEVHTGAYLGEDNIIRIEDSFGPV